MGDEGAEPGLRGGEIVDAEEEEALVVLVEAGEDVSLDLVKVDCDGIDGVPGGHGGAFRCGLGERGLTGLGAHAAPCFMDG